MSFLRTVAISLFMICGLLFVQLLSGCAGGNSDIGPTSAPGITAEASTTPTMQTAGGDNGPLDLKMAGKAGRIVDGMLTYNMRIGEAGVLSARLVNGPAPSGTPWWGETGDPNRIGATLSEGNQLTSLVGQVAIAEHHGYSVMIVGWGNLQSRIRINVSDHNWPWPGEARNTSGQQLLLNPGTNLPVEKGFATLHLKSGATRQLTATFRSHFQTLPDKMEWWTYAHSCVTSSPRIGRTSTIGRTSMGGLGYLIVNSHGLAVPIMVYADWW